MNNESPAVSVVVVSFKGGHMLQDCIRSLLCQDYKDMEIIAVDNGSGLRLEEETASSCPGCRWITLPSNRGFAGGCNAGILNARGRFIALINDDAVADRHWLTHMTACLESNPSAGAVASLVINGNEPEKLDSFGVGVALDGMSRQLSCGAETAAPRQLSEVLAFSGCSCMLRREAVEAAGLFDESFFAYCEDTDLSLRIRRSGWRILACPAAVCTHFYSRTGGSRSLSKLFLIARNHYWVAAKNFPAPIFAALPATLAWKTAVQAYALISGRGPVQDFAANGILKVSGTLLKAFASACAGMPEILRKRRHIISKNPVSGRGYARLLWSKRMKVTDLLLSG